MTSFIKLIPLLVAIIGLFALLQLYTGIMYGVNANYPFAALYIVLGFAGAALARALWVQRRTFGSKK
jgi:hypothetical protein